MADTAWPGEKWSSSHSDLPADQRRVLIMRDIQGSGRIAAEALGLSTAAMKSRLHRARATVRRMLRDAPDRGPGGNDD